jgi:hypothetical protein
MNERIEEAEYRRELLSGVKILIRFALSKGVTLGGLLLKDPMGVLSCNRPGITAGNYRCHKNFCKKGISLDNVSSQRTVDLERRHRSECPIIE